MHTLHKLIPFAGPTEVKKDKPNFTFLYATIILASCNQILQYLNLVISSMCWMPHPGTIKIYNGYRFLMSSGKLTNVKTSRAIVRKRFSTKMADKGYIFCKTFIFSIQRLYHGLQGQEQTKSSLPLTIQSCISTLIVVTCKNNQNYSVLNKNCFKPL